MVGDSARKSDKIKQILCHNCAHSYRTIMRESDTAFTISVPQSQDVGERSLLWRPKPPSNLTISSTLLCKRLRLGSGLDCVDLQMRTHASLRIGVKNILIASSLANLMQPSPATHTQDACALGGVSRQSSGAPQMDG